VHQRTPNRTACPRCRHGLTSAHMATAAQARGTAASLLRSVVHRHTQPVALPSLQQHLRLITPACAVYHMRPEELPRELGPEGEPFWGFVWPGSWGLSLHVQRHPHLVEHQRVLDFASGCGVSAIAAARAGARSVVATEIDPVAVQAIAINAELNGVAGAVRGVCEDLVGTDISGDVDVVLAGDICYDQDVAARVSTWFRECSEAGVRVLVGDPGRSFLPADKLRHVASYDMPHSDVQVLEAKGFAETGVWEM